MVAILFFGNILEVMMEEVYKQNFMDTYIFIKSKKELEKKSREGWMWINKYSIKVFTICYYDLLCTNDILL